MNSLLKEKFDEQIRIAKEFEKKGDLNKTWHFLERAHILGQYHAGPHVFVHWCMLVLAVKTKNFSEIFGQVIRIVLAAPGSIFERAPKGNTGRSDVGIFQPMQIEKELEEILKISKDRGI